MKLVTSFKLLALGALLSTAVMSSANVSHPQLATQVDAKIEGWIKSGYYNGASVIIVKDDRLVYKKYYGDYNPETVVYIASAGKWLAVATIAALVDEGKLSWDDPASKYIPELNPQMGKATLRQLLSHTAGYPDYQPANQKEDHYQTLKESVAHIVPLPADAQPGTLFKYGGLAMQVAGRMAEIATGQSWEELFTSHIAQPLGMKNTHFTPVSEEQGFSPTLGGGARTTLDDYAKFLKMIAHGGTFDGKRILSPAAIQEMEADQVHQAVIPKDNFVALIRKDTRNSIYGLGEWREKVDANGKVTFLSSPGWAGSYPWVDKENNIYGLILAKVDVSVAQRDKFNSFLAGSQIATIAEENLLSKK